MKKGTKNKVKKRILNLKFLLTNSKPLVQIIVFSSHYVVQYILNREKYFKSTQLSINRDKVGLKIREIVVNPQNSKNTYK